MIVLAKAKKTPVSGDKKRLRPASNPEAREQQMIGYAVDCAEQQLLDGTASPSVIVHYLKLGSSKNELELEKLRSENELLKAKTVALESAKNVEEIYANALEAFTSYKGGPGEEDA